MTFNGIGQFIVSATQNAAVRLHEMAHEQNLSRINERDHLQKAFDAALVDAAARWPTVPAINVGRKVALPDDFHKVGGVDNSIVWADERVFVELKAGNSLEACVWDAVKLAAALRAGACDKAFLVAAAPSARWSLKDERQAVDGFTAGAELFGPAEHLSADLRARYATSWRRWDLDGRKAGDEAGYRPKRAAFRISTNPIGLSARFTTANDDPWELRISQVRAPISDDPATDWLDWD